MKLYLILATAFIGTLCCVAARAAAPARSSQAQQVAEVTKDAQRERPSAARHLSEQERAELRRQLHQFNQQYTRRQ
jgi:hypothetical protein